MNASNTFQRRESLDATCRRSCDSSDFPTFDIVLIYSQCAFDHANVGKSKADPLEEVRYVGAVLVVPRTIAELEHTGALRNTEIELHPVFSSREAFMLCTGPRVVGRVGDAGVPVQRQNTRHSGSIQASSGEADSEHTILRRHELPGHI